MHFMEAVAEAVEAVERIPVVGPMIRIGTEVTGRVVFGTIHLVEGGVGLARSALGLGGHDGQVRSMEHHRVEVRSGRSKTGGATRPATAKRTSTTRPKKSTAKKTTRAKRPTAKRSTAKRSTAARNASTPSTTASSPQRGTLSAAEAAEAFTESPES
jgi:hypothetical protein